MAQAIAQHTGSDGFDEVFASYVEALGRSRGRPDAQVRAPQVFAAVWRELGCLPPPRRTVLITGSKGKGTTARLVAGNLERAGHRVGLVVTPEEVRHTDRIRRNGESIPRTEFFRLLARCMPALRRELALHAPGRYLSPTGIFLTVGLLWFAESGVDWWVIEGGRGVQWDEIGQLRARVAVVTSILPEHVAALGASAEAVLNDKLSIARLAEVTVAGAQAAAMLGPRAPASLVLAASARDPSFARHPPWYAELCGLAAEVLRRIGHGAPFVALPTPSFCWYEIAGTPLLCEPIVNGASIDAGFVRASLPARAQVVLGLSDDKDIGGILDKLAACGLRRFGGIGLRSTAGHISSRWLAARDVETLGEVDVVEPDLAWLGGMLETLARQAPVIYVAGVQVFVRCVRQALQARLAEAKV